MARKLDHRLGSSDIPVEIFGDRELPLRVNLIHERTDLHLPAAKVHGNSNSSKEADFDTCPREPMAYSWTSARATSANPARTMTTALATGRTLLIRVIQEARRALSTCRSKNLRARTRIKPMPVSVAAIPIPSAVTSSSPNQVRPRAIAPSSTTRAEGLGTRPPANPTG